jgi:hypothetical protein
MACLEGDPAALHQVSPNASAGTATQNTLPGADQTAVSSSAHARVDAPVRGPEGGAEASATWNGQSARGNHRSSNGPTSEANPPDPWRGKILLALGLQRPAPRSQRNMLTAIADGGGIRGYSSLLILRELMHEVARLESQGPSPGVANWERAVSSVHPLAVRPRPSDSPLTTPYLPSHYFDYIAGTSTGG